MAKRIRHIRGTTAEAAAYTGASGELVYDENLRTMRAMDGATPGGAMLERAPYKTVADLLASTELSRGISAVWKAAGFRYTEVASNEHLTTAGGVRLKMESEILQPSAFGVTMGTGISAALAQANIYGLNAMLQAASEGASVVDLPTNGRIEIANATAPLKVPSGIVLNGNRCWIIGQDEDAPVAGSKAYFDNEAPRGQGIIRDIVFIGTRTSTAAPNNQDGFILFDYHTRLENVEAWDCTGRGVVQEESDSAGTPASGTLVENRFINVVSRRCNGRGIDIAPDQLGKATDGWLIDPIVEQPEGVTHHAIKLGISAGWKFDGSHTYGGAPATPIEVSRAFCTDVGAHYVETFTQQGIAFTGVQENLSVGALKFRANDVSDADACAVRVEKSSGFPEAKIDIKSVQIEKNVGTTSLKVIRNINEAADPAVMLVNLGSYQVIGSNKSYVTGFTGTELWLSQSSGSNVQGRMMDDKGEARLLYEGQQLVPGQTFAWSGGGVVTQSVTIPYVSNFHQNRKMMCQVAIASEANDNGSARTAYFGLLHLSAKASSTNWKARLIDVVAPAGFAANPSLVATSITVTGAGTDPIGMTIQITFQSATSDDYGSLTVMHGPTLGD